MIRRFLFGAAFSLAACGASPSSSTTGARSDQPVQSPTSQGCRGDVQAFLLRAPIGRSRVVITFTGTQDSLVALWEATSVDALDSTLFPVGRTLFVLTIQARPRISDPGSVGRFANQICSISRDHGARFNGVILYDGNEMIDAAVTEPLAN